MLMGASAGAAQGLGLITAGQHCPLQNQQRRWSREKRREEHSCFSVLTPELLGSVQPTCAWDCASALSHSLQYIRELIAGRKGNKEKQLSSVSLIPLTSVRGPEIEEQ